MNLRKRLKLYQTFSLSQSLFLLFFASRAQVGVYAPRARLVRVARPRARVLPTFTLDLAPAKTTQPRLRTGLRASPCKRCGQDQGGVSGWAGGETPRAPRTCCGRAPRPRAWAEPMRTRAKLRGGRPVLAPGRAPVAGASGWAWAVVRPRARVSTRGEVAERPARSAPAPARTPPRRGDTGLGRALGAGEGWGAAFPARRRGLWRGWDFGILNGIFRKDGQHGHRDFQGRGVRVP